MKESEKNILIVVGAPLVGVSNDDRDRTPTGIAFAMAGASTSLLEDGGAMRRRHPLMESIRSRRKGRRHNFSLRRHSLLLLDDR